MKTRKLNHKTLGLAAVVGASLAPHAYADGTPSAVMTALTPTMLSGYVDTSAQWNMGTGNADAPGYLFGGPNKADGFNLNVIKLVLERDADLSDGWGAGYKIDLLFGPDANAYGTLSSSASGGSADFAVKQAYVDLKAPLFNGLEFKIGVWDTILGYEVFETPLNANFTRSYAYGIEPATFTGVQATYNFTELISVTGGIADAASSTINGRSNPPRAESYKTFLGDVSLTAPSTWGWFSGATLFGAVVNGFAPLAGATGFNPADQTSIYVGASIPTPVKALKFGLAYDYEGVSTQAISGEGYANAVGVYSTYQFSDVCSLNTRAEWFTQSKGNAIDGYPSKILDLTATFEYDLWKNVLSRAEFRWDHQADGGVPAFGGSGPILGTRHNSYELIANIIYKF